MRILVVEDDMMIAGNLCAIVSAAGHKVVGLAADCDAALALISASEIDLALIDVQLPDGPSGLKVARKAAEIGLKFVFVTGNFRLLIDGFHDAVGMIAKPYDDRTVHQALEYIEAALTGYPTHLPPRGLLLSGHWIERLGLAA